MNERFRSTRVSFVPRASQQHPSPLLSDRHKVSIAEHSHFTRSWIVQKDRRPPRQSFLPSTKISRVEEIFSSQKLNLKKSIDCEPVLSHHRNRVQEKRKAERRKWHCPIAAIICCGLASLLFAVAIAIIVTGLILLLHRNTITTTVTTNALTTITTLGTTICPTTSITTTLTSTPLPVQCSNYTTITDGTRDASFANYSFSTCDNSPPFSSTATWFRFSGAAGTLIATCPLYYPQCGTGSPGWYSGLHPSIAGDTINGTVCYTLGLFTCQHSNTIQITNCNGFYVYDLIQPPLCDARYCTI